MTRTTNAFRPSSFVCRLTLILLFSLISNISVAENRIVYSHLTDGYWQVWTMDSNGSNKRQVTFSQSDKRDPTWVNHGKEIAFRTSNGQLFLFDVDQKSEEEILSGFKIINNPDFSDRTKKFVFARYDPRFADISNIWEADQNGKNRRLLTKDQGLKLQPALSHKGDQIAFVKRDETDKSQHIWIMDSNGKNLQKLTTNKGIQNLPAFSPDETNIAFTSNHDGNYEIYLTNVKDGNVRRLTKDSGLDTSPSFSPDGQKIIFVSSRSGSQQIWIMNKDGSNPKQLTLEKSESVDPAWARSQQ